jgi:hypothetical protein
LFLGFGAFDWETEIERDVDRLNLADSSHCSGVEVNKHWNRVGRSLVAFFNSDINNLRHSFHVFFVFIARGTLSF